MLVLLLYEAAPKSVDEAITRYQEERAEAPKVWKLARSGGLGESSGTESAPFHAHQVRREAAPPVTREWTDPLASIFLTHRPGTIEVRFRDHGAGVWTSASHQRVAPVAVTG